MAVRNSNAHHYIHTNYDVISDAILSIFPDF